MLRRRRVHRALCDLGELLVGLLLFVERLLEQLGRVCIAELVGERSGSAIGGHLVMFDALGCRDESGIKYLVIAFGAKNGTPPL